MEKLLAAVIVAFLMVVLPIMLMGGLKMLNLTLWLKLNYPGWKNWPKDTLKFMYLPQAVALGVHPLLTGVGAVLGFGLILRMLGESTGMALLQGLGNIIVMPAGAILGIFIVGFMWAAFGSQGQPSPVEIRAAEAWQTLNQKLTNDPLSDVATLHRLWHTLFCHDRLSARFLGDLGKYRKGFKGLVLPPDVAEEVTKEIHRLRAEYQTAVSHASVPEKIKREIQRRIKSLESGMKFSVGGVNEGKTGIAAI